MVLQRPKMFDAFVVRIHPAPLNKIELFIPDLAHIFDRRDLLIPLQVLTAKTWKTDNDGEISLQIGLHFHPKPLHGKRFLMKQFTPCRVMIGCHNVKDTFQLAVLWFGFKHEKLDDGFCVCHRENPIPSFAPEGKGIFASERATFKDTSE